MNRRSASCITRSSAAKPKAYWAATFWAASSNFNLEMFVSPGGYICGEETALIEAIEGKRAEPRNKPPFPVIEGLWHKPTALNNVETFANVPQILTAAWTGTRRRDKMAPLDGSSSASAAMFAALVCSKFRWDRRPPKSSSAWPEARPMGRR